MKQDKQRNPLAEKGIEGALTITYAPDEMVIDFKSSNGILGLEGESFSEKTVFQFVTQSYAYSCLTLLSKIENYSQTDDYKQRDLCAYRFLPAMFCFRHYLELKLKHLYMHYFNESFLPTHDLNELYKDLKKDGRFNMSIFEEPIKFVENFERFIPDGKIEEAYFRYLADKKFRFQEQIKISLRDVSKVREFINEIEFRVGQVLMQEFLF